MTTSCRRNSLGNCLLFQTPVNNIVLTTIIALTAIFYQDNVMGAASLVSFGAVCGFFMVNFSVVGHYIIRGKERVRLR